MGVAGPAALAWRLALRIGMMVRQQNSRVVRERDYLHAALIAAGGAVVSSRETFIENNVIRNREGVLGIRDAVFIRHSRIWPGHGIADLLFFPQRGPHRLVIVEAKQASSPDAKIKVIGQLLMYYSGVLNLGSRGLRHMKRYAVEHPRSSRSRRHISGKALSGGLTPPQAAWTELGKGRKLRREQIALYAALDVEPGAAMKQTLTLLSTEHDLRIGVVSVLARDQLVVWMPD